VTDYYRVEALAVERDTADLHVTVIHPGANFPRAKNFALKLLWDARDLEPGDIYSAISSDQIVDEEWVVAAAPQFISSVEIVSGGPDTLTLQSVLDEDDENADAEAPGTAVYRVRVTAPKWLSHVQTGMTWASAAYDASYGEEDDLDDD
jgi:hypothetical protein